MISFLYKLCKSVIPCFLLTLSIGFCYAFSLFIPSMSEYMGLTKGTIQFAFCLNIFFLGMGAAFFGNMVEKHIKLASALSAILLFLGLCIAGIGVNVGSIVLVYLGIGVFCGISEGTGYIVPVKNLLLWWNKTKKKGLISAISIISFGLGSTLCSYLFGILFPIFGIKYIFFIFAAIYAIPTTIATIMINKPKYAIAKLLKSAKVSVSDIIKDKFFRKSWLFMFLNISMGLILIGSCAMILKELGIGKEMTVIIMMFCGLFNGLGRLVFPFMSDFFHKRINIWAIVLILEIICMCVGVCHYATIAVIVVLINALYGAGFATLPSVLSDHYGNKNLSQIHGYVLSAWGFASLFAYLCTLVITMLFSGYYFLTIVLAIVYILNLVNVIFVKKIA